jgi:hypothetical protein
MREMEEKANRAELGKRRDRQDGHDRQQGAKLGSPLFVLNENPHDSLQRHVLSRSSERRCPNQMCRIGHRKSRRDVHGLHKGEISAGGLPCFDKNFEFLFRLYIVVSLFIWFLYGL